VEFLSILIWSLLLGVIPGAIASKKGYNFWTWWLFGVLLFLPALIIILARGPNPEKFGKCPYCKGLIERDATVCPHCGRDILVQ
jgi:hypothetical protein